MSVFALPSQDTSLTVPLSCARYVESWVIVVRIRTCEPPSAVQIFLRLDISMPIRRSNIYIARIYICIHMVSITVVDSTSIPTIPRRLYTEDLPFEDEDGLMIEDPKCLNVWVCLINAIP